MTFDEWFAENDCIIIDKDAYSAALIAWNAALRQLILSLDENNKQAVSEQNIKKMIFDMLTTS